MLSLTYVSSKVSSKDVGLGAITFSCAFSCENVGRSSFVSLQHCSMSSYLSRIKAKTLMTVTTM